MTIYLENETDVLPDFDFMEYAQMVADKVLEYEKFPYEAEVNLVITDNEEIKRINRQFRQIDAPTDVLSFPMIPFEAPGDYQMIEEDETSYINPDTGNVVLGDIMISVQRVLSQAEEYGHSVIREYSFLIAHSMLHLLGYDHMEKEEADVMEQKQHCILELLQIQR